jgi:putative ABC transport system permease protein
MDTLLQDVRYAVRTLRKSPGFTLLAVLCLALGIGVNATLFSVVDAAILRPFPFHEPDRLVMIKEARPKSGIERTDPSWRFIGEVRTQAASFEQLGAFDWRSLTLADGDEPIRLQSSAVTTNLFPMLGIAPVLGRSFSADDARAGAPGVLLISHAVWQGRYAGDPRIVGRVIRVNDVPRTVVGVMPERFAFPVRQDLWIPLEPLYAGTDTSFMDRGVQVMARLAPGVTLEAASAEVATIGRRLAAVHGLAFDGWRAHAESLQEELVSTETRVIILTMMGAVTFVLLIACANVANLMLARATSRHREVAVRTALGAGRWRIVRQLLTESVLVSLLGGALGVFIAMWGLDLLDAAIPPQDSLPYYIHWTVNRTTLAYTLAVAVGTGLLFGLAPALQSVKGNLQEGLKEGTRGAGTSRNRLRSALVVAEVSLSLVLLVGASLFVRSFMNLERTSAGFDTAPLMSMRFYMPPQRYPTDSARAARTEDIVRRIEAVPAVEAAFASNLVPLEDGGDEEEVVVESRPETHTDPKRIFYAGVTPHFLRTLDVPVVRGRDLTEDEARSGARVALVDERLATRLFGSDDPIGQRFRFARDTTGGSWFTIVGVVRQFSYEQLDERDHVRPAAYVPFAHMAWSNTGLVVRVRGGDPAGVTRAVRTAVHAADPALPVFEELPMEQVRRVSFWQYGLFSGMFGIFGGIALLLAAIGVYGVISYGVAQRTHEIGVRVALGAERRDVLRMVVGQGVRLAAIGIVVGVAGAAAVTRVITSYLVEVSPTDPLSFAAVSVFLTAVAVIASLVPARRASGVDPINALRAE